MVIEDYVEIDGNQAELRPDLLGMKHGALDLTAVIKSDGIGINKFLFNLLGFLIHFLSRKNEFDIS